MKFILTDEDGVHLQEVDEAYIDGYAFGDRAMEGVWFGFKIVDGVLHAFVNPDQYAYVSKHYNVDRYLEIARRYALKTDLFASSPEADDDAVILIK